MDVAALWAAVFIKGRMKGNEQSLDTAGVLGAERGAHHAGVQRVGGDAGALQPPGQLVDEQDVGELG